jgi:hypothetical protein
MAKRKKKGAPKKRNILVPMMRERYREGGGAGSHGDARKAKSRKECRGRVKV